MKSIKEKKKTIVLSKKELELLKGGDADSGDYVKKDDWGDDEETFTTNPPHD